ncbi:hypothetical protein AKO1_004364, partial [Acrasis kona]
NHRDNWSSTEGFKINNLLRISNTDARYGSKSKLVNAYVQRGSSLMICICIYLSHALYLPCLNGLLNTSTRVFFAPDDPQTWVYAVLSCIVAITLCFFYTFYTVSFYEWRNDSRNVLSKQHCRLDVHFIAIVTFLMILLQVFAPLWINNQVHISTQYIYICLSMVLYFGLFGSNVFYVPYYSSKTNFVSCTCICMIWFASACGLFATISIGYTVYDAPLYMFLGTCVLSPLLGLFPLLRCLLITLQVTSRSNSKLFF